MCGKQLLECHIDTSVTTLGEFVEKVSPSSTDCYHVPPTYQKLFAFSGRLLDCNCCHRLQRGNWALTLRTLVSALQVQHLGLLVVIVVVIVVSPVARTVFLMSLAVDPHWLSHSCVRGG